MLYDWLVVSGYTVLIGIVIIGNMYFIMKNMNVHDAETVDPKPDNKY